MPIWHPVTSQFCLKWQPARSTRRARPWALSWAPSRALRRGETVRTLHQMAAAPLLCEPNQMLETKMPERTEEKWRETESAWDKRKHHSHHLSYDIFFYRSPLVIFRLLMAAASTYVTHTDMDTASTYSLTRFSGNSVRSARSSCGVTGKWLS